ncbi:MAG: Suppressor of fused protein [Frankiales bacterium]|nr:Suppressor of fused protein [Frankiales bacterium]
MSDLVAAVRGLYLARFGEPLAVARFDRSGEVIEVAKWNTEGVFLYATLGGCVLSEGDHLAEYFCGLSLPRDDIASALAALAAYDSPVGHGDTVPGELWANSPMRRFLVLQPTEDFLPPLRLPDDDHVGFMQAIPLYDSELIVLRAQGPDLFMRGWEEDEVAFWDPCRLPTA